MRRLLCMAICGFLMAALFVSPRSAQGANDHRGLSWVARRLIVYLPNRALDALDAIGVNVSLGLGLHGNAHATRFAQLGAGSNSSVHRFGNLGREVGVVEEERREMLYGPVGSQQLKHVAGYGTWQDLEIDIRGSILNVMPEEREMWRSKRDRAGIGIVAHLLVVGAQLEFRPREACDFFLGCIGIDFMNDDMD